MGNVLEFPQRRDLNNIKITEKGDLVVASIFGRIHAVTPEDAAEIADRLLESASRVNPRIRTAQGIQEMIRTVKSHQINNIINTIEQDGAELLDECSEDTICERKIRKFIDETLSRSLMVKDLSLGTD